MRNPFSRRNRGGAADPWWRTLAEPDLLRAEPETPCAVVHALREFARREVGLVVVDGGDGTVREVLSALPQTYGAEPPVLAVLASGTTNLIAADVGAGRSDPATICALARLARTGVPAARVERRRVLEVSWPDGSHPPVSGMFLGAGAFTRATELSFRVVRRHGHLDEGAGVAATLVSALARTVIGRERDDWLKGDPICVSGPDGGMIGGPRFLVLATTLHKLMLGLWPFWGEGKGGLRYLDVAAPPRRLAAALPAVMYGRPRPWMAEAGYRSGLSDRLDIALTQAFIVDGEHFAPGPGGTVRVQAGRTVDFIVP
ncbi:MAG TPA: diacylglycerol kinase family protein [Caulobacteraceae bacterium]|nr:diacylglycerol kinase family protein [Caulobacteraceae bacterium]